MEKKAILLISSGTSNEKARRENIEALENRIAHNFSDYGIRRAFTSGKILQRLKEQGMHINNPTEALKSLAEEGFEEVIVQPLHIIPGMEYEKVISTVEQFKDTFQVIGIGRPLLYEEEDFEVAVGALKVHLPEVSNQQAYALMGHGSSHIAHQYYERLQNYIHEANLRAFIGTIKGAPGINQVMESLKKNDIKEVILVPYMLVAGNHALSDMASEEENSWKSILLREGFKVKIYLRGLGESKEYQDIYINKIKEAIAEVEEYKS